MDIFKGEDRNVSIEINGNILSCYEVEDPDDCDDTHYVVKEAEFKIKKILKPLNEDFEVLGKELGLKIVADTKENLRFVQIEGMWETQDFDYEESVFAIKQNGRFFILPHALDAMYFAYKADEIRNQFAMIAENAVNKEMRKLENSGLLVYGLG